MHKKTRSDHKVLDDLSHSSKEVESPEDPDSRSEEVDNSDDDYRDGEGQGGDTLNEEQGVPKKVQDAKDEGQEAGDGKDQGGDVEASREDLGVDGRGRRIPWWRNREQPCRGRRW